MPTNAEMFETIRTWQRADCTRDQRPNSPGDATTKSAPLRALSATYDLVESLKAGRWDMITAARLGGATWEELARAMNQRADEVRNEYAAMVDWCNINRPDFEDLDRYRAALHVTE